MGMSSEHPTDIQFQIHVSWRLDFMCFHAIVQDFLCLCASSQKFKLYILIPHKMRRMKFSPLSEDEDGSTEGSRRGKGCSYPQEREVSYINYEKR